MSKWIHVTFKIENSSQSEKINQMRKYLGLYNISFDTGGMIEIRDWEIDWSFRLTEGEDTETQEAADKVEEMINQLPKNN